MKFSTALIAASLLLAGSAGFLTSQAVSQTSPAKTVTIDLKNGEQGIPGPPGPKGEPGGTTCPDGFVFGKLIINHPGGHATIYTCITPESN